MTILMTIRRGQLKIQHLDIVTHSSQKLSQLEKVVPRLNFLPLQPLFEEALRGVFAVFFAVLSLCRKDNPAGLFESSWHGNVEVSLHFLINIFGLMTLASVEQ